MSPSDVLNEYKKKNNVNRNRQASGYWYLCNPTYVHCPYQVYDTWT